MKCYKQIFTYDKHIGYKYVPNLNVTVTGDYLDQLYDYKIKTDRFGFRNSLSLNNNFLNVDILFIGCSFTAGDGLENKNRFSELINLGSYNAALSGSDLIQQMLIVNYCKDFINTKKLIYSPYLGCINRINLKSRSTFLHNSRHIWFKPYYEVSDGKFILKNYPVPKPQMSLSSSENNKEEKSLLIKRLFKSKSLYSEFLNSIYKAYSQDNNFSICKQIYLKSKLSFPNSRHILMPLGNYYFLKFANKDLKKLVTNFYQRLSKEIGFEFYNINNRINKSQVENMFYKKDGHFNIYGHKTISEMIDNYLK